MRTRHLLIVFATTVAAISTLYAPQPILPMFRSAFGVSEATAALLVTVAMLPLGAAPLVYGSFLESFSSKHMMAAGTLLLAATSAAQAFTNSFDLLLGLRFLQGLALPALLTSLMTYLSASCERSVMNRVMSVYIATTVFGGFFGRFCSGQVAEFYGWRSPFFCLAAALAVLSPMIFSLPRDARPAFSRLRLSAIPAILAKPGFFKTYAMVFCMFFVFAAVLNVLPFRLAEITGVFSASRTGMMYLGYLAGIAICLYSSRVAALLGGTVRAMATGIGLMAVSLALFSLPREWAVFSSMFLLCSGMVLTHGLAPGLLNTAADGMRGVVNGLYLSFYYSGGVLGSWLPGLVREHFGFVAALGLLFVMVFCAFGLAVSVRRVGDGPRP